MAKLCFRTKAAAASAKIITQVRTKVTSSEATPLSTARRVAIGTKP